MKLTKKFPTWRERYEKLYTWVRGKNMHKHEPGCPAKVNRYSDLDLESTETYCTMCGAVLSSSEEFNFTGV